MLEQSQYSDLLYRLRELRRAYPNFEKVNRLFLHVQNSVSDNFDSRRIEPPSNQVDVPDENGTAVWIDNPTIAPLLLDVAEELLQNKIDSWVIRLLGPFEQEFLLCTSDISLRLLLRYASSHERLGYFPELESLLRRARHSLKVHEKSTLNAEITLLEAVCLFMGTQYEKAIEYCKRAISLAKEIGDTRISNQGSHLLGRIYSSQGRAGESIQTLFEVLQSYELSNDLVRQSGVLKSISGCYRLLSEIQSAESAALKALHLAEKSGSEGAIRAALVQLSSLAQLSGDYARSIELGKRALAMSSPSQDVRGHADILYALGDSCSSQDCFHEALPFYEEALVLYQRMGNRRYALRVIQGMTDIAKRLGERDWALDSLASMIAHAKSHQLSREYRILCVQRAAILADAGQIDASMMALAEAQTVTTKVSVEAATDHFNDGYVYWRLGYLDRALEEFERALKLFSDLGEEFLAIRANFSIASIYLDHRYQGMSLSAAMPYVESVTHAIETGILCESTSELNTDSLFERVAELSEDWQHAYEFCRKQLLRKEASGDPRTRANLQRSVVRTERLRRKIELTQREQAQSELIAALMPENIAEALIAGKKYISADYPVVSLLMLDIVGFTVFSTKVTNTQIVDFLNRFFSRIDAICLETGVEKIKTIGDAYLACCGAPYPDLEHARKVEQCAGLILKLVCRLNDDPEFVELLSFFSDGLKVRIGLHTGSVIGGVVGLDRYQFDLWGDAVDRVKEIESTAEPNTIMRSSEFEKALRKAR